MNLLSYIKEALWTLVQNKMRSILSLLGIMIGIASVVVLRAFWDGMKAKIIEDMAATQNIITLQAGQPGKSGGGLMANPDKIWICPFADFPVVTLVFVFVPSLEITFT